MQLTARKAQESDIYQDIARIPEAYRQAEAGQAGDGRRIFTSMKDVSSGR